MPAARRPYRAGDRLRWKRRSSGNPRLPFVHAYLAAAYALEGQTQRAQTELAAARCAGQHLFEPRQCHERRAGTTIRQGPRISHCAEATYFEAGLRKAGLPER